FVLTDRMIITTRLKPLRSVERARMGVEKNAARFSSPLDIFELLVIEFQRTLISLVIEMTEELNLIADVASDNTPHAQRRGLAPAAGAGWPDGGAPASTSAHRANLDAAGGRLR